MARQAVLLLSASTIIVGAKKSTSRNGTIVYAVVGFTLYVLWKYSGPSLIRTPFNPNTHFNDIHGYFEVHLIEI